MAGLPVVYPDTLPHPEVGQFTPRERRAINREFMRPISRDRAGTRSVAFTFTPAQAREFREWYQEWVTMGGGMFAAPWPMPWGRGPHVFRFVEPPVWQLVGGGIDGQGYWRVTADVELRGRGEMPTLEVFTVLSQLYPVYAEDAIGTAATMVGGWLQFPVEALKMVGAAITGGLWTAPAFYSTSMDAEAVSVGSPVITGGLWTAPTFYAATMLPEAVDVGEPEITGGLWTVFYYLAHTEAPEGVEVGDAEITGGNWT